MPIQCTHCSRELPEQAAFCWRCGHVRRTERTPAGDAISYETCEVVYGKSASTGKTVFWARALGDRGSYTAAESVPLPYEAQTYLGVGSRPALDGLLADLVGQGWESLGTYGTKYWDQRLRRRVPVGATG